MNNRLGCINRDKNAVNNIKEIVLMVIKKKRRPLMLSRDYKTRIEEIIQKKNIMNSKMTNIKNKLNKINNQLNKTKNRRRFMIIQNNNTINKVSIKESNLISCEMINLKNKFINNIIPTK